MVVRDWWEWMSPRPTQTCVVSQLGALLYWGRLRCRTSGKILIFYSLLNIGYLTGYLLGWKIVMWWKQQLYSALFPAFIFWSRCFFLSLYLILWKEFHLCFYLICFLFTTTLIYKLFGLKAGLKTKWNERFYFEKRIISESLCRSY